MSIFEEKDLDSVVATTKAQEIFEGLLVSQYYNSPNFREFSNAYLIEMDFLFEHIERVFSGRFLEFAEGTQLDIIGDIVGVSSELGLLTSNYGFLESLNSGTFGTVGDEDRGSIWNTRTPSYDPITLSDSQYRRAVRAKAVCNGAKYHNVDFMYEILFIIIGEVPKVIRLEADTSAFNVSKIVLTLEDAVTEDVDLALIEAMRKYFIPAGYLLEVQLV
jgi:hypothetical protein